jgi:hypothetical protein
VWKGVLAREPKELTPFAVPRRLETMVQADGAALSARSATYARAPTGRGLTPLMFASAELRAAWVTKPPPVRVAGAEGLGCISMDFRSSEIQGNCSEFVVGGCFLTTARSERTTRFMLERSVRGPLEVRLDAP